MQYSVVLRKGVYKAEWLRRREFAVQCGLEEGRVQCSIV